MLVETPMKVSAFKLEEGMHIHLVGIGGSGLSAIAFVLLGRGFKVSGSDEQMNEFTLKLANAGCQIYHGHQSRHCEGADILLISSAIPDDNIEVIVAKERGIPVYKRAEFLRALMVDDFVIAVAGSHGKTTTTGMIGQILIQSGLDPSIIVGGVLPFLGSNGRAGNSEFFVIEADEYDHMFLGLVPKIAVITNIDYDHPDLYPTKTVYQEAFGQFIGAVIAGGTLVVCQDDAATVNLASSSQPAGVGLETFGLSPARWQAVDIRSNQQGGNDFLVLHQQKTAGLIRLRVPGEHNIQNALAAIAVATRLEIDFNVIRQGLADFGGISRRFQIVGKLADVIVIDDYGHHPTEIQATLAAARQLYGRRRIWAVWQPHTFSRTKSMLAEFAASFDDADRVIILDIYQSREVDSLGIDINRVAETIDHPDAHYLASMESAAKFIVDRIRPGDVVITLSAGDGNLVGELVLTTLKNRNDMNQRFAG